MSKQTQVKLFSDQRGEGETKQKGEETPTPVLNIHCTDCGNGSEGGVSVWYGSPHTKLNELLCNRCYKKRQRVLRFVSLVLSPKTKEPPKKLIKKRAKKGALESIFAKI